MSRRGSLPGAEELLRASASADGDEKRRVTRKQPPVVVEGQGPQGLSPEVEKRELSSKGRVSTAARPSHRQRHDEKITVYLSSDELVALDEAKAVLYRELGLKVDRGRIVREAVAVVMADLRAKGESSILARRLRG